MMSMVPSYVYQDSQNRGVYHAKERLLRVWEEYLYRGNRDIQQDIHHVHPEFVERDFIIDSWQRCLQYDVKPTDAGSIKNLPDDMLEELRKMDPTFQMALPIIRDLKRELQNTRHAILYCNREGVVLEVTGDPEVVRLIGSTVNVTPGAVWSEPYAGTNAIGTSMVLKKPVQVFAAEHFTMGCHMWACASTPILDPFTGDLLAVLNLSTLAEQINLQSMMMSVWGAKTIEQRLAMEYYQAKEMLQHVFMESTLKWKQSSVFLLDLHGKVLFANDKGVEFLKKYAVLEQFQRQVQQYQHAEFTSEINFELDLPGERYEVQMKKISWRNQDIARQVIVHRKERPAPQLSTKNHTKYSFQSLIGHSPAFLKCVQLAKKAATSDANILITGESGTGKELIAHAIHHASQRSGKPFIAINCAAIPKELLASELFGYVGGAFTGANPKGSKGKFQLADGGTLFLDEVGDMPMDLQVQLLRAIQEQEIMPIGGHEPIPIDVRIIAATNKNLEHEIREGRFREDLYYRIKVFEIALPALRERAEDIPLLSRHFLNKFAAQKGCGPYELSEEALECLQNYHWPGNIRQLQNAMEYAVTMAEGERITPDELPAEMRRLEYSVRSIRSPAVSLSPVEQAEARWICDVLAKHRFDLGAAARELNMNRSSIYRKIKKYGMDIRELKKSLV